MGIHDHLACPLLDTVHKLLHAGDRILIDEQYRRIGQDLIRQRHKLGLIERIQTVKNAVLQKSCRTERDTQPGKHTACGMLCRLDRCIFRTLSVGLET